MSIVDLFFDALRESGDYTVVRENNGAYLYPTEEKSFFMLFLMQS